MSLDYKKKKIERLEKKLDVMTRLLEEKTREAYNSEQKALSSLKDMESMFESLNDSFVITDSNFRIEKCNHVFEQKTEKPLKELNGSYIYSYMDSDNIFSNRTIEEVNSSSLVSHLVSKSGKNTPVIISMADITVDSQNGYVFVFRDVSARIAMEKKKDKERKDLDLLVKKKTKEIEKEKRKAEQANRTKSMFLANMSHEIRTPLNTIIALSQMIDGDYLDSKHKSYLEKISMASGNLYSLVNDLLDFSKIEAGELLLEKTDFNLKESIQEACQVFEDQIISKGLDYSVQISDDLNGIYQEDSSRLKQIISNLLSNALKFTNTGLISVSANTVKIGSQKNMKLSVLDTGIGIHAEKIDELFAPFIQEEASTTRKFGGTGLGLSICSEIVKKMNGNISVMSKKGDGSIFTLILPLVVSNSELSNEDLAYSNVDKLEVLVVEDNPLNQDVMRVIIKELGHALKIVGSGESAIEICKIADFDLIFMDIQMPGLDGFQTTKEIRKLYKEKSKSPLILGLSANALKEDQKKAAESGMDDYYTKPVTLSKIRNSIGKWFGVPSVEGNPHLSSAKLLSNCSLDLILDSLDKKTLNDLITLVVDGSSYFPKAVENYISSSEEFLRDLGDQVSAMNRTKISKIAHKFKSSCGIVGATKMLDLLDIMEQSTPSSGSAELESTFKSLEIEYSVVKNLLSEISIDLKSSEKKAS
jgi:PAS domain S-box-containing protein